MISIITISEQLQQRHLAYSITDGPVTLNINNLIKDTETKLNKTTHKVNQKPRLMLMELPTYKYNKS
jgi:hypothetical protein